MIWLLFVLTFLFGGSVGFWYGYRRAKHAGYFTATDDAEVAKWRAEAERAVTTRIERRLGQIESRAREQGRITNDTVEEMFCIGDRTASRYLAELVRRRVLVREGRGRGTYYELAPEVRE